MRFKDKKGNILVDIEVARQVYCNDTKSCVGDCNLDCHGMGCVDYVRKFPVEAAKYMGFEIIEDAKVYTGSVLVRDDLVPKPTRESILEAAKRCVCDDREQDYGSPESNFALIASLWTEYLGANSQEIFIEPHDVAAMLGLLKIARIATGHAKEDNWVDLAGYAAIGGEIQGGRSE